MWDRGRMFSYKYINRGIFWGFFIGRFCLGGLLLFLDWNCVIKWCVYFVVFNDNDIKIK